MEHKSGGNEEAKREVKHREGKHGSGEDVQVKIWTLRNRHDDPAEIKSKTAQPFTTTVPDTEPSRGEDKRTHKKSSGSSRIRRDRDAKQRARSPTRDKTNLSPGAVSETNDSGLSKQRDRKAAKDRARSPTRETKDRHAKTKGRSPTRDKKKSSPGAVAEDGDGANGNQRDRDAKSKARGRSRKNTEPVVPGAVKESNDSTIERSRKRKENRNQNNHLLKHASTTEGLQPPSGLVEPDTNDEETLPFAAAIEAEEIDSKLNGNEYTIEGNLVAPVTQPPAIQNFASPAALGAIEEASEFDNDDSDKEPKEKPFWYKGWFWIAVVFVLVAGGVAVMFALKQDATPSDTSSSPPSEQSMDVNITQAPQPTVPGSTQKPASNPTDLALYQPPSEEDCNAIASGSTVADQGNLVPSEYLIELDVTLPSFDAEEEIWRNALNDAFQEKLFPAVAGCSATLRRLASDGRNLQQSLPDFVIANGKVVQSVVTADGCKDGPSNNCFRVKMILSLWLRDTNASSFYVVAYLVDTLGATPVDYLALSTQLSKLVVVTASPLSPTEQPTMSPSSNPSNGPTVAPVVASNPTLEPVIVDATPSPTVAPVVGSNPVPTPTSTPSQVPTRTPTDTPSANPTSAPVTGPSPPPSPRPTRVPTKAPSPSPTFSPSKSPTRSPSSRPTVQSSGNPTGSPTLVPSKVPTTKPSVAPSKSPTDKPSAVPTKTPTDRPTFVFDGHGVPVYADWDNQGSAEVDGGRYFLFVPSDWEAVFGSFPSVGVTTLLNVEHRRNDEVMWQGEIAIWNWSGTRPEFGIPGDFEHGRRNPRSIADAGQWQTGDIIVPRYVSPNIDWRNPFASGTLANAGWYFRYQSEDFEATFGSVTFPVTINAIQCRDGEQIYSGSVRFFGTNGRRGTTSSDYGDPGDFEAGDYLLPPNMACPKAIRPSFVPVPITRLGFRVVGFVPVNAGTHFSFDNNDWKAAFEYETWGVCPQDTCVTISRWSDSPDPELAYWWVRQCRGATEIWSGIVATSVGHWYYPSETGGVGRRDPRDTTTGQFQSGDTIVPYSRSCA